MQKSFVLTDRVQKTIKCSNLTAHSHFLTQKRLDRCTSTDIENLILEFNTEKGAYDFEAIEKNILQARTKTKKNTFAFSKCTDTNRGDYGPRLVFRGGRLWNTKGSQ